MGSRNRFIFFILFLLADFDEVTAQALGLQSCEYEQNGQTLYNACVGDPVKLLIPGKSNYNLTVTPADVTCGLSSRYESFCLIYAVCTQYNVIFWHWILKDNACFCIVNSL